MADVLGPFSILGLPGWLGLPRDLSGSSHALTAFMLLVLLPCFSAKHILLRNSQGIPVSATGVSIPIVGYVCAVLGIAYVWCGSSPCLHGNLFIAQHLRLLEQCAKHCSQGLTCVQQALTSAPEF